MQNNAEWSWHLSARTCRLIQQFKFGSRITWCPPPHVVKNSTRIWSHLKMTHVNFCWYSIYGLGTRTYKKQEFVAFTHSYHLFREGCVCHFFPLYGKGYCPPDPPHQQKNTSKLSNTRSVGSTMITQVQKGESLFLLDVKCADFADRHRGLDATAAVLGSN